MNVCVSDFLPYLFSPYLKCLICFWRHVKLFLFIVWGTINLYEILIHSGQTVFYLAEIIKPLKAPRVAFHWVAKRWMPFSQYPQSAGNTSGAIRGPTGIGVLWVRSSEDRRYEIRTSKFFLVTIIFLDKYLELGCSRGGLRTFRCMLGLWESNSEWWCLVSS